MKWTDRPIDRPSELKALLAFCARHDIAMPIVTSRTGTDVLAAGKHSVHCMPASVYSFTVGRALVTERIESVHAMVRDIR